MIQYLQVILHQCHSTYPLAKNALFENDRKEKLYICNVYFISICYIMCVSK
jgi:hypothetical protein